MDSSNFPEISKLTGERCKCLANFKVVQFAAQNYMTKDFKDEKYLYLYLILHGVNVSKPLRKTIRENFTMGDSYSPLKSVEKDTLDKLETFLKDRIPELGQIMKDATESLKKKLKADVYSVVNEYGLMKEDFEVLLNGEEI